MNKSLFIINPSGNLLNSSTFTGSSFQITNSNLSEQNIVKVSIDLSTAIFPDLVFDPNGEAGDSVAKGFTVDGGLFTGVDSHSFTNERDGGFDVLNINFTNFNPGETLKFSLDIDPTSTKNTSPPGPGESGSVSGLELVGSTISVEYENGDTLTGQVYQISGSEIGSQIDLTPNLTTAPMIEVVDITITSATVEDANQTVRITGTVGSEVSLLIIEGAFFTEDGVGFDADPFEANTAIAVDEITATIGAEGFVDVPVTLTRSNPDGGLNYFKAAYVDQNGNAISYVSETVIMELDSELTPPTDSEAPSASLNASELTAASSDPYSFSVTYLDNVGIELATIDESDITVTAPDGVVLPITGVEVNTNSNSASTTATYSIEAPGGDWDEADNGEYTVALNESQVSDINSNSLSAETLGSFTVDITTPSSDGVIRINAGSSQDAIDSSGNLWQADTFFVGGQILGPVNTSIADTTNDFIYQVQRADDSFSYAIPVDNGNYNINLHLSELTYTDFNQRSFDVSAEGELVFDNLDIFGETKNAFLDGTNTAKVLTVPAFSIVRDGELNLDFDSVLQDATIAGIEISPIVGSQVLIKENGDTVVSEGGNSDSYTVVLNSQPTADVTIDLQLGSDLSADKTSLLFTSENWSVPQTVNLTAVDDSSEEGFETTTIAHTINTSDPNYSDLTVPSVSVDINDNDSVEIKFDKKTVANLESPTTGAWGPDGRLYVGTINGEIKAYTFDDNYNVTDEQTINALTGVSNPSILGIAFNPFETTANGQPKIYVSHSQLYANGGTGFDPLTEFSPYSGQVSVLEGPDFTAQPLITGIGVSNHDHGVNGLEFDNEGNLLIAVGGNTNAGIADDAIGGIDESPFTAAILKAEISQPDFNGNIEYELPADWTAPEGLTLPNPEDSQGFGGIVNVASGVDVSVYASGFRNPYDLTLTTKGLLYATENGANADFGDVSTGANSQEPFTKDVKDELNLVVEDGYYGHPNRNRGRNDSRQNVYYAPSDSSNSDHTAPIYDYFVASTNGITEYRATTFSSQLRGNLLAQKWKNILYNVELSSDGTEVLDVGTLKTQPNNNVYAASGLDVLTGAGGEILGIDYTRDEITVATPIDNTAAGMTAYDILQWRAPATGGSEFTIGGVNFSGSTADTTVTIGNEVATITSVSEQRITGILPSFTDSGDSLLDITVQSNDEVSTITDAFQPIFG